MKEVPVTPEEGRVFWRRTRRKKIDPICHGTNKGVGGSIPIGYRRALNINADLAVVMAADAQMDSANFDDIVEPLLSDSCD